VWFAATLGLALAAMGCFIFWAQAGRGALVLCGTLAAGLAAGALAQWIDAMRAPPWIAGVMVFVLTLLSARASAAKHR